MLAARRRALVLAACATAFLAASCSRPASARAAARAFTEATLRGDRAAMKHLVLVPAGTADGIVDAAIDAKIAQSTARRRVAVAAAKRFGATGASPGTDGDLHAVESARVETNGSTASIKLPGGNALVLEKSWRGWSVRLFAGAHPDAYRRRMEANAAAAGRAAEHAIHDIETGTCPDARSAAELFDRYFFAERFGGSNSAASPG